MPRQDDNPVLAVLCMAATLLAMLLLTLRYGGLLP